MILSWFFLSYTYIVVMNNQNNIMVCNCRGAASSAFYRYCNQYVTTWKPLMLVIMETRFNPDKLKRTFIY
jgi:hypothetical protein